ncbi:hypothetical protein FNL55_19555 [Tardiphaga sp. vice352]|uniref:hypothetical protein n=1 Tax=Tardiphaga sp. vice352 TaxID=2592816 RepID=UPI001164AFD2|nr:hypothetical protein [Tardiphaga sp. vice352]QDM33311.1 hypothetical protein FNL55_19555 [Tardiphaga sp. vice352]
MFYLAELPSLTPKDHDAFCRLFNIASEWKSKTARSGSGIGEDGVQTLTDFKIDLIELVKTY